MQTAKTTRSTLRKLFGIVIAGAFAAVPMAGVIAPTQAEPLVLAQRDRNRDTRTIEGVVTVDREGRNFTLRQNNGVRIQVRTDDREPRRLSNGDRVRVTGYFRRNQPNLFIAESIQILTNQNNNSRSFTGRVTDVDSDQRFDILIGNRTYNVISTTRLPRRLNRGDMVRVYGRLSGSNDIVNATVVVINNNNDGGYGDSRTFTGRVTEVESDQRFDMLIGNRTYNVISTTRLPRRLNRGDMVRVYGRLSGDNDIRNATVVVINDNNNNGVPGFSTYEGRVTEVESDQRFDVVVNGTTFNVISNTRLPRRLNRDDRVRIYGRRSGSNDIINASVVILNNR